MAGWLLREATSCSCESPISLVELSKTKPLILFTVHPIPNLIDGGSPTIESKLDSFYHQFRITLSQCFLPPIFSDAHENNRPEIDYV
jgi:hypothetical protein